MENYYKNSTRIIDVPLSDKPLDIQNNIKGYAPILEQVQSFKNLILENSPNKISTIGGDCGIEVVPISYLNKIYNREVGVVWMDSHADLNTPESSPSKEFHGMPLRLLLGEGDPTLRGELFSTLKPEQVCFVGLRDIDKPESAYIAENNISSLSRCSFSEIRSKLNGFSKVYIHLDLDVLDKDEYKHTLFPTSNGLKIYEVSNLIKDLKGNYDIVGICITESTADKEESLIPIKSILEQIEI